MDVPLVTLLVEDEWNSAADATAKFRIAANFARSSWDWIGLYKVNNHFRKLHAITFDLCRNNQLNWHSKYFTALCFDGAAVPQVGFKHHKDYVGYVWAKQEEADFHRQEHQVI